MGRKRVIPGALIHIVDANRRSAAELKCEQSADDYLAQAPPHRERTFWCIHGIGFLLWRNQGKPLPDEPRKISVATGSVGARVYQRKTLEFGEWPAVVEPA